jgi:hypothetical protein
MELKHVVVDGSNIATEGRSLPSLKQLDEAVRSFLAENPTEHVTVIVDATFGHRIDASERAEYEEAILAGELITPPAGAIGRGDKFVLQIADRADAAILSNDSFQEFHGEYTWLFDEGRLIGGKPVPGVGWVFLLRTPVRGPASRRSVRDARASGATVSDPGRNRRGGRRRKPSVTPEVEAAVQAVADAPREAIVPINEPLPFIEFVANHPVGSHVEGEVERFASHGAYVRASGARCYLGLKFMGDPAPRSAKDVLRIGETRLFAVHGFDTPRRGIDLALVVGVPPIDKGDADDAVVDMSDGSERADSDAPAEADGGRPRRTRRKVATGNATAQDRRKRAAKVRSSVSVMDTEDTISGPRDSSVMEEGKDVGSASTAATARVAATKAPTMTSSTATKSAVDNAQEAPVTPVKKAVARKATAKKKAVAKRAPAKKKAVAKKATAVRKTAAKRAPAKKAVAKKAAAKKAVAKKATAKRAPAKRAVAKKATAKKATAKRTTTVRKAAVRKTAAKKVAVKRAAVKRAPARKAVSRATATRTTAVRRTAAAKAPTKRTVAKRAPIR